MKKSFSKFAIFASVLLSFSAINKEVFGATLNSAILTPNEIRIPSAGISSLTDTPFSVQLKVTNDSVDNFLVRAFSFTVIEDDSFGTGFNDSIGTFTQADTASFTPILVPMMSMRTFTVTGFTLSESSLESSADGSGDNAGDDLEFFTTSLSVAGDLIPKPTPEPTSIISICIIGLGSTLLRKKKHKSVVNQG